MPLWLCPWPRTHTSSLPHRVIKGSCKGIWQAVKKHFMFYITASMFYFLAQEIQRARTPFYHFQVQELYFHTQTHTAVPFCISSSVYEDFRSPSRLICFFYQKTFGIILVQHDSVHHIVLVQCYRLTLVTDLDNELMKIKVMALRNIFESIVQLYKHQPLLRVTYKSGHSEAAVTKNRKCWLLGYPKVRGSGVLLCPAAPTPCMWNIWINTLWAALMQDWSDAEAQRGVSWEHKALTNRLQ